MTPSSSDRARTISPIDIFGLVPHPPMPAAQPSQAFEIVLNKATAPGKAALHRQPAERTSAERQAKEPDARADSASEKSTAAARKKQQARAAPSNEAQRKAADQPSDEPSEDPATCPPTSDSSPSCPPPEEVQEVQDEKGAAETQVDPASQQDLGDKGNPTPSIVAIAEQILIAPPQPISPGDTHPHVSTVPSDVGTQQVNKADLNQSELNPAEPGLSGDVAIPPNEHAATVHGNGPLSLAEPKQDAPAVADPVTPIDGQMAAEEVQPAEPVGNSGEKKDGSSENDRLPQKLEAIAPPALPGSEVPTSQEVKNAATPPPPPPTDAPSSPKEAPPPPPQQATSQPTTGVQPSPNRLPQHVLSRYEAHPGHNPAPVPIDSARFLSRVAKAFLSAQQRDGEVRLRLSPPELGSLRLQVSVQDGVMVARMETETEAARSSLVNNLPALRERLAEQGIRIERFDIDLMQRPPTGTPDRPSDPQQQHEPEPLRLLRAQRTVSEAPKPAMPIHNWNGQGRLNVII